MVEAHSLAARPAAPGALSASYSTLPARFFARLEPTPVAAPLLIRFNAPLAAELGLEVPDDPLWLAQVFSGNRMLPGAEPLAMAYAGHQFGHFVPQLGDGRAILLGERAMADGSTWDIQLKGSGRTPFSRSGDGRAAIGPVLREYVVSEAMFALGVPTTRALAAVATGETVYRDGALPGGVFTRVAASHVRVGTFEYFAARGDIDGTRALADYVIDRHYPALKSAAEPYFDLLCAVMARQAALVAQWMAVGFIHGVMNTDNMTVSGQSIDFGPCAFMDGYQPDMVFSSIDQRGRYAYDNQPAAAQWNLARFAETLLPLFDSDQDAAVARASAQIATFPAHFQAERLRRMCAKLGLASVMSGDDELLQGLLDVMREHRADFTVTFRALADALASDAGAGSLRAQFTEPAALDSWLVAWRERLQRDGRDLTDIAAGMRAVNPAFIPRNHRIEAAITAAVEHADYAPFNRLVDVLRAPFDAQVDADEYAKPPLAHERVLRTFCGT